MLSNPTQSPRRGESASTFFFSFFSGKFFGLAITAALLRHSSGPAPHSLDLVSTKEHGDDVPEAIRKLEANDNAV